MSLPQSLLPAVPLLLSLTVAARVEMPDQRRRQGLCPVAARQLERCRRGAFAAAAGAATSSWRLLVARQRCIRDWEPL